MGTSPHASKHEWSPIVRGADGNLDLPATRQNIQKMDADYERWGWKFPSDVFHVENVTGLLRNPGFIVVTRDLTEIALSSLVHQDVPFEISLHETAHVSRHIADRMRFWPWPILVVPFAEALRHSSELVETLCKFLQINPEETKRKQAADFVQPLTRGYRAFDASPDQLHDFSAPEDNVSDSQNLAMDFSARYSKEYLQHFEGLVPQATAAANRLAARIRNNHELQIASESLTELCHLLGSCTPAKVAAGDEKPRRAEFNSVKEWRSAVNQSLERLSIVAQRASKEALHSPGNYDALTRLYRALQLLIRVCAALDGSLRRIEFEAL